MSDTAHTRMVDGCWPLRWGSPRALPSRRTAVPLLSPLLAAPRLATPPADMIAARRSAKGAQKRRRRGGWARGFRAAPHEETEDGLKSQEPAQFDGRGMEGQGTPKAQCSACCPAGALDAARSHRAAPRIALSRRPFDPLACRANLPAFSAPAKHGSTTSSPDRLPLVQSQQTPQYPDRGK